MVSLHGRGRVEAASTAARGFGRCDHSCGSSCSQYYRRADVHENLVINVVDFPYDISLARPFVQYAAHESRRVDETGLHSRHSPTPRNTRDLTHVLAPPLGFECAVEASASMICIYLCRSCSKLSANTSKIAVVYKILQCRAR